MGECALTIVVVNWNRVRDLQETLPPLIQLMPADWELLVVDNGSTDGSVDWLRKQASIRRIELGRNEGPCAARNRAAETANGEYLFFLDSDADLREPKTLARYLEKMRRDPEVGLVGFKILNTYTGKIDQWIYSQPKATHKNREFETYSFSAAGALVSKKLFLVIGGFWEELFIYGEEVDLSLKLMERGYRILYSPEVELFHRDAPEGRAPSAFYFKYQARNWLWIFSRYFPGWHYWWHMLLYTCVYFYKGLRSGQMKAVLRGISEGWKQSRRHRAAYSLLSPEVVSRWKGLNRRWFIRTGR